MRILGHKPRIGIVLYPDSNPPIGIELHPGSEPRIGIEPYPGSELPIGSCAAFWGLSQVLETVRKIGDDACLDQDAEMDPESGIVPGP